MKKLQSLVGNTRLRYPECHVDSNRFDGKSDSYGFKPNGQGKNCCCKIYISV